ncbi:MAG TPA: hypothetical protein VFC90_11010 [Planctomycetota bacterium]|nr:hypothetical protein [Planctomycetota bacterium]
MESIPSKPGRLEFAGSVVLGSVVCILSSLTVALLLVKSKKWSDSELAVALRWSAVLSIGLLLILAAWRKMAPKLPGIPRFVVGVGLGVLIAAAWALFVRGQYGSLWASFGAPLLPCWVAGAPAGFLVSARPRLRPDFFLALILCGIAGWSVLVAMIYWPPP